MSAGEGPSHRYIGASPGCWEIFCRVLAREYSDLDYHSVHRLTVDSYAVQHPGSPSPQSIRSVALHLIGLYSVLEQGYPPAQATRVLGKVAARKASWRWLEPPPAWGSLSVLDVLWAKDPSEYREVVFRWAGQVWAAWAAHHDTIRRWAKGQP